MTKKPEGSAGEPPPRAISPPSSATGAPPAKVLPCCQKCGGLIRGIGPADRDAIMVAGGLVAAAAALFGGPRAVVVGGAQAALDAYSGCSCPVPTLPPAEGSKSAPVASGEASAPTQGPGPGPVSKIGESYAKALDKRFRFGGRKKRR